MKQQYTVQRKNGNFKSKQVDKEVKAILQRGGKGIFLLCGGLKGLSVWGLTALQKLRHISFVDSAMEQSSVTQQAAGLRNPGGILRDTCQVSLVNVLAVVWHESTMQVHGKGLMKVFKFQLAAWQWKSDMWKSSQLLAKKKWEVLLVISTRNNKKRGGDLFWHLVCVAASHPCTAFPVGWGDLRLFRIMAVICHRFKWQYFWVLSFFLLVSQIVSKIIISEQVGRTKVKFIILRRESIILRHSQGSGEQISLVCPELL